MKWQHKTVDGLRIKNLVSDPLRTMIQKQLQLSNDAEIHKITSAVSPIGPSKLYDRPKNKFLQTTP